MDSGNMAVFMVPGNLANTYFQLTQQQEELNRLDIFHKVFLLARDNKPFLAPIRRTSPRIMDIGTGTGIWAINVAEECLSDAEIMAVDLNQIQPALIPPGFMPKQYDIEEPSWGPLLADCDLIHMRMLLGSIQTDLWPQVYHNAFEHLAPGIGFLEHIEVDWIPRCDDDERPANSAFVKWAELFLDGMDRFNRRVRVTPQEHRQMLEATGFTDIRQEVIKAYVCPWSADRNEREIARWFNIGLSHSLEAMSLKPLIEKLGFEAEEVRELSHYAEERGEAISPSIWEMTWFQIQIGLVNWQGFKRWRQRFCAQLHPDDP
ncbi:methyl transferase [Fusarium denticulatum]|uniref:Methyl transferase n=1 Tax=Fusarium denticulatum TaxID=48507 RepID=A0A8H5STL2_9HYPO|nr:methyl transferase [Fusarium denticulatum]